MGTRTTAVPGVGISLPAGNLLTEDVSMTNPTEPCFCGRHSAFCTPTGSQGAIYTQGWKAKKSHENYLPSRLRSTAKFSHKVLVRVLGSHLR